jgi:hypothetical protein
MLVGAVKDGEFLDQLIMCQEKLIFMDLFIKILV